MALRAFRLLIFGYVWLVARTGVWTFEFGGGGGIISPSKLALAKDPTPWIAEGMKEEKRKQEHVNVNVATRCLVLSAASMAV